MKIIFALLLVLMTYKSVATTPDAPALQLSTNNFNVSIVWNLVNQALGYKLYYAPYPQAKPINHFDMGTQHNVSIDLPSTAAFYVAVTAYNAEGESPPSNIEHFTLGSNSADDPNRTLIVIAAPSVHDPYYKANFEKLIAFDIQYAQAVMGKDNVVVLADKDTLPYFKDKLPQDILLEAELEDIWMRDFSPPSNQVKFAYDRPQTPSINQSFLTFAAENNLQLTQNPLKVDGGNVVDNQKGQYILTEKVLERNSTQSYEQITSALTTALGATNIAIIPMDEAFLGHSDGMVMFIDENTLVMNDYQNDAAFKNDVVQALKEGLSASVTIHEIEGTGYGEQYGEYASACGIYVNSVVTNKYIYMPTFGNPAKDNAARDKIQSLTQKTVIPIDAQNVCFLGGNTRCLTWQLTGDNATKLIEAARQY